MVSNTIENTVWTWTLKPENIDSVYLVLYHIQQWGADFGWPGQTHLRSWFLGANRTDSRVLKIIHAPLDINQ